MTETRKWPLGRAFMIGMLVGAAIVVINLVAGNDPTRGTTNAAQAGGALVGQFILPVITGAIAAVIALIRNLFVK
jgi:hypothetical protein